MSNEWLVLFFILGVVFVGVIPVFSGIVAPKSFNPQKFEPYECGIPTEGVTWLQFNVGYYLFAILFLIFDVETCPGVSMGRSYERGRPYLSHNYGPWKHQDCLNVKYQE